VFFSTGTCNLGHQVLGFGLGGLVEVDFAVGADYMIAVGLYPAQKRIVGLANALVGAFGSL
jgi:hypothetical protein